MDTILAKGMNAGAPGPTAPPTSPEEVAVSIQSKLPRDVFTSANFEIATIAAVIGYILFEFLRKRF